MNDISWKTKKEAIVTKLNLFFLFRLSLLYLKGGVPRVGLLDFNNGVHGENEE